MCLLNIPNSLLIMGKNITDYIYLRDKWKILHKRKNSLIEMFMSKLYISL